VKHYITTEYKKKNGASPSNGTRRKLLFAYDKFAQTNQIPFDHPKCSYNPPVPLIPQTTDVEAIISHASQQYATIFRILSETGAEGHELEITPRNQIDLEQGTISIVGIKDHDNGTYKLSPTTTEMLRLYLAKHPQEHPFPTSKMMGETWRHSRRKAVKKLCQTQLGRIPFKNLRNYAGAIFYLTKGKDPIQTMHFMRHKQLETTADYLRGITNFTARCEYVTKATKTMTEELELMAQGFEYITQRDEYKLWRKLKY
jgi:integrase